LVYQHAVFVVCFLANMEYIQVRDLLEDDGIFLLQIAGLRRAFQVCLL
jgi:hypothetical protein